MALLQVGWSRGVALIDPLCVDLEPLSEVIKSDALIVMHAASQDIEVLEQVCKASPKYLFDTQLAAGFLGMSSPSLATLHEKELGLKLQKSDRLSDWFTRPLTESQRNYAASDVANLLQIHSQQVEKLIQRGRLAWAEAECAELLVRESTRRRPRDAWKRIKEARKLKGRSLDIARSLAAWRESRAAEVDLPVRYVLPDLAIVAIAQKSPSSLEELTTVRGVERHHLNKGAGREILNAISKSDKLPKLSDENFPSKKNRSDLRAATVLIAAWLSQMSQDLELDPVLLGTRADIEALISGEDNAKMANGWRDELVGSTIQNLLEGRSSLAFDGFGRLLLEVRKP